ncbi:MAG: type II secretion system F family protein, partial [Flexilinea flocculi]|nr:type II secretion system F family protein [Flexilinea flocculi]
MQETLANSYLSSFCLEVSLILKAGIIISEGISMLAADEKYPPVKSSLLKISADMESGNSITASMRSSNLFPKYMLDMVAIGEKTGQLEKVFKSLSEYYNRQVQITQMIRDAVLYPLILLLMMFFVIILLVTQVFPIFADVYAQIGTVLPPTAVMLMNVGSWLKEYWPFVL